MRLPCIRSARNFLLHSKMAAATRLSGFLFQWIHPQDSIDSSTDISNIARAEHDYLRFGPNVIHTTAKPVACRKRNPLCDPPRPGSMIYKSKTQHHPTPEVAHQRPTLPVMYKKKLPAQTEIRRIVPSNHWSLTAQNRVKFDKSFNHDTSVSQNRGMEHLVFTRKMSSWNVLLLPLLLLRPPEPNCFVLTPPDFYFVTDGTGFFPDSPISTAISSSALRAIRSGTAPSPPPPRRPPSPPWRSPPATTAPASGRTLPPRPPTDPTSCRSSCPPPPTARPPPPPPAPLPCPPRPCGRSPALWSCALWSSSTT